jgi:hypothetical protein
LLLLLLLLLLAGVSGSSSFCCRLRCTSLLLLHPVLAPVAKAAEVLVDL